MEFMNSKIDEIPPGGSWSPSVEIYIGEVDTYMYFLMSLVVKYAIRLYLEVYYSSDAYKKDLEQFSQPEKYANRTGTYEILAGKNVVMHFLKKYRFESTVPFAASYKTCKTEVFCRNSIYY